MAHPSDDYVYTPHIAQQHERVSLRSPLEIIGAFIYLLRDRFSNPELEWVWNNDPTATDITIASSFSKLQGLTDSKPGIYVDKGQTTYGEVAIGDYNADQPFMMTHGLKRYYSYGEIDVDIQCVSPRRGESMQLADAVQKYFHMSSKIIQAFFNFHNISPILMNRTSPYEKDEDIYTTPIAFRVSFELQWHTIPVASTLNKLTTTIADSKGEASIQRTFQDIYLGE